MQRVLDIAGEMLRAPRERVAQWVLLVRADLRLRLIVVGGSALLLLFVAAGLLWTCQSADGPVVVDPQRHWRYLVVCEACQHRARAVEHPARTLEMKNGLLQCPECREFQAAWYRRGTLSLPPGGWSTSRPATEPAAGGPTGGGAP